MKKSICKILLAINLLLWQNFAYAVGTGVKLPGFARGDANQIIERFAGRIIDLGYVIAGVVFAIAMVYAGIVWIVSEDKGDEAKIKIRNAIIGGLIVSSAIAVTSFMFS